MNKIETSIIFFHIPKTGGITLNSIIERQYDPSVIYSVYGPQVIKYADEFKSLPLEQRMKYKVLKGHMWLKLKLHEYMPQPWTYISVLRDPIDRTISFYYYILRTPSHYLYEKVVSQKMSLQEFASSEFPETSNVQTGLLLDDSFKPGQDRLEIAKNNILKYFLLVGVLDKFDDFLLLAQKMFGWKDITYTKQNVTENRPSKKDLSRGTLDVLKKYNQLDIQLYKFAKKRMIDLIAQQKPSFKQESYIFRKAKKYTEICEKDRAARFEVIQNQGRQIKKYKNDLLKFEELSKQACEKIYKAGEDLHFLSTAFRTQKIVFGTDDASLFMRSGWSYNETLPSEGLTVNWAIGSSASLFLTLPKDKPMQMTAHVRSHEFPDPQIITIRVDGKKVGLWKLSNKWEWEQPTILINPDNNRRDISIIEFQFSQTQSSQEDPRLLAVLFESLTLKGDALSS